MSPLSGGHKRLYDLMVSEARCRDRLSFGADGRHAQELGCSRRTIIRWRKQLEQTGWIARTEHPCPSFRTVCYRFPRLRVTQRTSCRKTPGTSGSSRIFRNSGPGARRAHAPRCGRRRKLMEEHPDVVSTGVQRASGEVTPFNAGDAIAATVDVCREMGIPLAPSIKARLGKGSKDLLDAGFSPRIVVASCVHAVRTGWFGSVETIAQEIVVAEMGGRIGRDEHKRILAELSHQMDRRDSLVWQTMREEMARRAERTESA